MFPDMFNGIITPEMLVTAAPMQFKVPTLQAIKRASQARQQSGQQAAQSQQMTDKLSQALSIAQIAKAQEDMADAQEKRSQIPLNNAKTMVEIQKLQAEPIISLIKEQVRLQIAQQKQNDSQKQLTGGQQ